MYEMAAGMYEVGEKKSMRSTYSSTLCLPDVSVFIRIYSIEAFDK